MCVLSGVLYFNFLFCIVILTASPISGLSITFCAMPCPDGNQKNVYKETQPFLNCSNSTYRLGSFAGVFSFVDKLPDSILNQVLSVCVLVL
jgi:hypothetical protein